MTKNTEYIGKLVKTIEHGCPVISNVDKVNEKGELFLTSVMPEGFKMIRSAKKVSLYQA